MLLISVLIFLHLLGDFYFQPDKMAKSKIGDKNKMFPNFGWLSLHGLIYAVFFLPLVFMIPNVGKGIIILIFISLTHLIIDKLEPHTC